MIGRLAAEYADRAARWSDVQGHLPYLLTRAADHPRILELGVRSGNSTAAFLYGLALAGDPAAHLWSVDITPPTGAGEYWPATGLWTLTIGDDTDQVVAAQQPDQVDLLFIDTSHHYQHTLDELAIYGPRVRPGGVILLHDVELAEPDQWDGEPFPVARALNTWSARTGIPWTARPGSYGLGIITIP